MRAETFSNGEVGRPLFLAILSGLRALLGNLLRLDDQRLLFPCRRRTGTGAPRTFASSTMRCRRLAKINNRVATQQAARPDLQVARRRQPRHHRISQKHRTHRSSKASTVASSACCTALRMEGPD